jgi:cytidylate kinase
MLIAIDGPAGAGKSTAARALAARLGFAYLDSGAMYRCVALEWLRAPGAEPGALARAADIAFGEGGPDSSGPDSSARVLLDGEDVTDAIRSREVSEAASRLAADPEVRRAIVDKQRALLAAGDWVADGRDIGTVVAPGAELKLFLSADPRVRAQRRAGELGADPRAVLAELAVRDRRDSQRDHSPLQVAPDAVTLDTSDLSPAEVLERITALVRARRR